MLHFALRRLQPPPPLTAAIDGYERSPVPEPVNKFPEFVAYLVRWLTATCPTMGKVRIAQVLARAGMILDVTTVGRMLKKDQPDEDASEVALAEDGAGQ